MLPVIHHAVFGAYTCIAENVHGKLEKVVMLTEGAKPGTPHIKPIKIYPDGFDLFIQVGTELYRGRSSLYPSMFNPNRQCTSGTSSQLEICPNYISSKMKKRP